MNTLVQTVTETMTDKEIDKQWNEKYCHAWFPFNPKPKIGTPCLCGSKKYSDGKLTWTPSRPVCPICAALLPKLT